MIKTLQDCCLLQWLLLAEDLHRNGFPGTRMYSMVDCAKDAAANFFIQLVRMLGFLGSDAGFWYRIYVKLIDGRYRLSKPGSEALKVCFVECLMAPVIEELKLDVEWSEIDDHFVLRMKNPLPSEMQAAVNR